MIQNSNYRGNGIETEDHKMENVTFNSTTVNVIKAKPQNDSEHNLNFKVFSALNQQHG